MALQSAAGLTLGSITCLLLLAACNDSSTDSVVATQPVLMQQANQALTQLTDSLVWQNNQCETVYANVLEKNVKAQAALQKLQAGLADTVSGNLKLFIARRMMPKLQQLDDEAGFLQQRCIAPDYDGSGVSMERPAMLREMLSEWQGILRLLTIQLNTPPNMRVVLQPATATQVSITASSPAGLKFKDCTEGFCPEMTVIPAGSFLMGGSLEEQERENVPAQPRPYELPQHLVRASKPFAMATYETTLAQFKQFQQETGWQVQGCRNWETRDGVFSMWYRDDLNPQNSGFMQTEQDPVVCVRREDGQAFAEWLSAKSGKNYRLPTEAEWEYAARAGTSTTYFWGNDPARNQACRFANVLDSSTVAALPATAAWSAFNCNDTYAFTAPVGKFQPNAFGLYDMSANAREWMDDCWHPNYNDAPADTRRWGAESNGLCNFPVLRGGAWIYNTYNVRIAYRNAYYSSQARSNMWGFRVVRDI